MGTGREFGVLHLLVYDGGLCRTNLICTGDLRGEPVGGPLKKGQWHAGPPLVNATYDIEYDTISSSLVPGSLSKIQRDTLLKVGTCMTCDTLEVT